MPNERLRAYSNVDAPILKRLHKIKKFQGENDRLVETIARILCMFSGSNPDDSLGSLKALRWTLFEHQAKILIQKVNIDGFTFEEN
jgi:hypothetical protein